MSKEETINYAITQLKLRELKTSLNVRAVLEFIWIDGYEKGEEDTYNAVVQLMSNE